MKNKKPTYEELGGKLAEAEKLIAKLQENRISIDKHEHDSSILSTKELAEAFIASEQNFKNSMDECPLGVRIVTEDGDLIYANKAALKTFGYRTVEDLAAAKRNELYTPESYAAHQERRKRRKLKEYVPGEYEISIRRPNGDIRNLRVYRREVMWGGEQQFMAMYEDITERKRAEGALRESEDKFHNIVEHSNDGIVFIEEGIIQYCNSKMLEISGYTARELIGKSFIDFVAPEQKEKVLETYRKRLAGEEVPERYELNIIAKTGSIIYTETSASLFTLKQKMVDIVIVRDISQRRKVLETLRQSEEMFAKAFRSSPDAVTITTFDEAAIIIDTNDTAVKNTGYSFSEMIGHSVLDLNLWANLEDRKKMHQLIIENGRVDREEYQFRKKTGELRTWEFSAEPIIIGGRKCIISVQRDITEQKQAQEALKEGEETFTKAFFNSPSLMAISTVKDGRIVEVNDIYCRVTGYNREELIGHTTSELNLWCDPEQRKSIVKMMGEKGIVQDSEVQMRTKSGKIQTINLSTAKITLKNEPCLLTIAADITERKRAEEAVRESEREKAAILNGVSELVTYQDRELKVIWANRSAGESVGISPEELVGRHCYEIWQNRSEPCIDCPVVKSFETGRPHQTEMSTPNGRKWFVRGYPVLDEKGNVSGVTEITLEITERKKMEETLEEEREDIKLIIDSSPILVFYKDMKGKFLRVNKAFATALNMTEEDFLGKTVYDLYSKQIAQGMTDDDNEVFKTGRSKLNVIEQYESASGLRWVQTDKIPIFDKSGKVSGLVGFALDVTERKRAEEALISSETRYRRLFESAKDGILILNAETGQIIDANPFLLDMLGFSFAEIVGKELWEIGLFKDIAADKEAFLKLQNKGYIRYENLPLESKDGAKRDVEFVSNVYQVNDTRVVQCNIRDITERKLAAEALQESEERFNKAFHASPNLMAVINLENGQIIEVNEQHSRITGFERHEVIGKTTLELNLWVYPEKREEFYRIINTKGRLADLEVLMRSKSNEIKTLLYSAEKISLRGINCIVTVALDITERKEAEERISHLNLTLRAIRDVDQLITREKDRDLLIQSVCDSLVISRSFNSAWIVLLDEKQQPLAWAGANMSKEFPALVKMMRQNEMPSCVVKALKQKRVVVTEEPHKTCQGCPALSDDTDMGSMTIRLEIEGKIYGVFYTSIPKVLINDKDEISLFTEVATDIAFALRDIDLVAANELLVQERLRMAKLESIGMLAGGIAHDFNNLLTGIMGNIGLAKTYISTSDNTYEMLDEAERAALRAKDLTQQLLTFARGGKPVKKPVNTYELIRESAEFGLRGSKAKLILSLPEDVWQIEADEGQISQVINNLVINADEAMPAGGTLRIHAENEVLKKNTAIPIKTGNYVRIDIEDTGIGISPEHLQRIFEPYFTTKQRGSGLGLTTAYSVVRNHGGIILAESVRKKGSIFRIYLPATKRTVKGGKKLTAIDSGQAGGKVLIMDDEEIIRKMLTNMLGMAGYTVEVSADGAEALEKYKQAKASGDPFNAVIMDLTVPGGMGGKEAVKKLLEIDPKATVIVSSGYATDPIMSDFKKYGFKAVIAKPYSVRQLRESLSNMLTKKKR